MTLRRFVLGFGLAASVLFTSVAASARVPGGGNVVRDFRDSTDVFVGRVEQPEAVAVPLAASATGEPTVDLVFIVTHVYKGSLSSGERVTVRWQGWADATEARVGGCRTPGAAGDSYPFDMLVFAQRGADAQVVVSNRSSSSRVAAVPQSRRLLRQVAGLARRGRPTRR